MFSCSTTMSSRDEPPWELLEQPQHKPLPHKLGASTYTFPSIGSEPSISYSVSVTSATKRMASASAEMIEIGEMIYSKSNSPYPYS